MNLLTLKTQILISGGIMKTFKWVQTYISPYKILWAIFSS